MAFRRGLKIKGNNIKLALVADVKASAAFCVQLKVGKGQESKVLVNTSVRLVNNKLVIDLPEGAWEYSFDTTLAQNIRFDNDFFKKLKIERGGHAITQSYYYLRGTANNESFNNFFNFDDISFGIESESKYENIEIEINGVSRKYRYFERYIYDREDVEAYLESLND